MCNSIVHIFNCLSSSIAIQLQAYVYSRAQASANFTTTIKSIFHLGIWLQLYCFDGTKRILQFYERNKLVSLEDSIGNWFAGELFKVGFN